MRSQNLQFVVSVLKEAPRGEFPYCDSSSRSVVKLNGKPIGHVAQLNPCSDLEPRDYNGWVIIPLGEDPRPRHSKRRREQAVLELLGRNSEWLNSKQDKETTT